jgi:hypothetical protein
MSISSLANLSIDQQDRYALSTPPIDVDLTYHPFMVIIRYVLDNGSFLGRGQGVNKEQPLARNTPSKIARGTTRTGRIDYCTFQSMN